MNKSSESRKLYWFYREASASPRQKSLFTKWWQNCGLFSGAAFTIRGGALGVLPFACWYIDWLRQKRNFSVPLLRGLPAESVQHGKMAFNYLLTNYLPPGHDGKTMCLIFLKSTMHSITKIIKPPWPTHLVSKNGAIMKASCPKTEVLMFSRHSRHQVLNFHDVRFDSAVNFFSKL